MAHNFFYDSMAWRRCRVAFMRSKYYVCERCGGVAAIAHHRHYITAANVGDPAITLNWDNLECLCHACHNREHSGGGACANGVSFGPDGSVIYTPRPDKKY